MCFRSFLTFFTLVSESQQRCRQSCDKTAPTLPLRLTDVTVLARPAREALAEVSSNQISAGVGVDAGAVGALVGI